MTVIMYRNRQTRNDMSVILHEAYHSNDDYLDSFVHKPNSPKSPLKIFSFPNRETCTIYDVCENIVHVCSFINIPGAWFKQQEKNHFLIHLKKVRCCTHTFDKA